MNFICDIFFPCCLKRKIGKSEPDERTPILPLPENGPSVLTYDSTTIDHEGAKERLHSIVKSKEGKMVRVLSRVPFDLRTDSRHGHFHSSRHRSPSNCNYTYGRATDYINDPGSSRPSSSKASPPISRSESTSSLHRGSISRISTSEDFSELIEHKLKVQLMPTSKSKQRAISYRGRSRTKQGRFTGEDQVPSREGPLSEGIQSMDADRPDFGATVELDDHSKPSTDVANAGKPVTGRTKDENDAMVSKSTAAESSAKWKISFDNVGALTRSWGD